MKPWKVQVLVWNPDRISNQQYTVKACSVYDALAKFERFRGASLTYEDIEIKAVWQASEGDFRCKRNV